MAEHCMHEQDWGKIITLIETHHKELYGNGQPGIAQMVTEMSGKIANMTTSVEGLSTNVSALMKFENEFTGIKRYKEKEGLSSRARASLWITAIVGVAGIIMMIINKFA